MTRTKARRAQARQDRLPGAGGEAVSARHWSAALVTAAGSRIATFARTAATARSVES